jgi:hypothetical protein
VVDNTLVVVRNILVVARNTQVVEAVHNVHDDGEVFVV